MPAILFTGLTQPLQTIDTFLAQGLKPVFKRKTDNHFKPSPKIGEGFFTLYQMHDHPYRQAKGDYPNSGGLVVIRFYLGDTAGADIGVCFLPAVPPIGN